MSAFGQPKYVDRIYEIIKINPDGSFKLNMKYFSYHYSTRNSFNNNFVRLFGKPRGLGERFILDKHSHIYDEKAVTDDEIKENRRYADIASSIQKVAETALIKIANYLYTKTEKKKLCMAGGWP